MFNLLIEPCSNSDLTLYNPFNSPQNYLISASNSCQDSICGKVRLFKKKQNEITTHNQTEFLPIERSLSVCVLSAPSYLKDFLLYLNSLPSDFIKECLENLAYIRTVYTSTYFNTILLLFKTQSAADNFYLIFNGREFEEPSNEYCYVVFTSEVKFSQTGYLIDENSIELPICPLCIERIDVNSSGITGVLRNEVSNLSKTR